MSYHSESTDALSPTPIVTKLVFHLLPWWCQSRISFYFKPTCSVQLCWS